MDSQIPPVPQLLARRGRAVGALFFSGFGALWIAAWYRLGGHGRAAGYGVIALAAAGLIAMAIRILRTTPAVPAEVLASARYRRTARWFHIINTAQWLAILVVVNILSNLHHAEWIIPGIIAIVGLHFLPLAPLLHNRVNAALGLSLLAIALIGPRMAGGGPSDPVLCLATGAVLWGGALSGLLSAPELNAG